MSSLITHILQLEVTDKIYRFVNESLRNQVKKLLAKGVSTEDAIMEEMNKEKSQLEELFAQNQYKTKVGEPIFPTALGLSNSRV